MAHITVRFPLEGIMAANPVTWRHALEDRLEPLVAAHGGTINGGGTGLGYTEIEIDGPVALGRTIAGWLRANVADLPAGTIIEAGRRFTV